MPQQVESKVSTVRCGIICRAAAAAPAVPNAFWWQWPCSSAVLPGIGARASWNRPALRALWMNSPKSIACEAAKRLAGDERGELVAQGQEARRLQPDDRRA